jgi:enoyl-CoA hydratase/carnithine racemase
LVLRAKPRDTSRGRIWVAGGDLKELTQLPPGDAVRAYAGAMSRLGAALESLPTIVVAAVDGAAIGGGAELVLMADVRLMTKDARLEWKQVKVGLATGYGTAKRLVDVVGLGQAQGLLYGAKTVDAAAALARGRAPAVRDDAAALTAGVKAWTEDLIKTGRAPLAAQKAMLRHAVQGHPGTARAAELQIFTQLWRNPEHSRFLADFAGRKDP